MTALGSRSRPRFWKTTDRDGVRDRPSIHGGDGVIRVKSFFDGEVTTGVHFHVWELPPGATEGRHTHPQHDPRDNWEELYYVLSGRGVATFEDGKEVPLEPGDGLLVPLDVDHGLENRGTEPLRIVLMFAHPAAPSASD
ncbi:MAG: cupin domain-containing protein [Chloroflexi bacterium]|nr:cupin domain-containing protein [Chloroflexota bacterium]